MATFQLTTGAIACLSHTLLLHGSDFFSAMDITGDGYHIIIHDPYQNPSVQVRRPFSNHYEQVCQPHLLHGKFAVYLQYLSCMLRDLTAYDLCLARIECSLEPHAA